MARSLATETPVSELEERLRLQASSPDGEIPPGPSLDPCRP